MELNEFGAFPSCPTDEGLEAAIASSHPRMEIEQAIRSLIAAAGDDPDREGLRDTPSRVARAYREWFAGYRTDPKALLCRVFGEADGYDDTVLLRDIPRLTAKNRDRAWRFITLIDSLYEKKVKLICSAEAAPEKLYTEGDGTFEFDQPDVRPHGRNVLDVVDGAELIRVYAPYSIVSALGEIQLTNTDAVGYQVTLDMERDAYVAWRRHLAEELGQTFDEASVGDGPYRIVQIAGTGAEIAPPSR